MTPFEIEVILHFDVSAADYPHKDAPIYPEVLKMLKVEGILWEDDGIIRTTTRGQKYCEMLRNTPLPLCVDPRDLPTETEKPAFLRKIMD